MIRVSAVFLLALVGASPVAAQQPAPAPQSTPATTATATPAAAPAASPAPATPPVVPGGVTPPPGYVIGADDVLTVVFWRDKEMSNDVTVRPDGRITLPLVNDVQASGLTPEELRASIAKEADRFIDDPTVSVVVKQINSRKVFITGMVSKPGVYSITAPTNLLQLISMAGGLQEFADSKHIIVTRTENGRQRAIKFNYRDALKGKNLKQNIELQPGDTVLVP